MRFNRFQVADVSSTVRGTPLTVTGTEASLRRLNAVFGDIGDLGSDRLEFDVTRVIPTLQPGVLALWSFVDSSGGVTLLGRAPRSADLYVYAASPIIASGLMPVGPCETLWGNTELMRGTWYDEMSRAMEDMPSEMRDRLPAINMAEIFDAIRRRGEVLELMTQEQSDEGSVLMDLMNAILGNGNPARMGGRRRVDLNEAAQTMGDTRRS